MVLRELSGTWHSIMVYTIHTYCTDHNLQSDHSREWREFSAPQVVAPVNQVYSTSGVALSKYRQWWHLGLTILRSATMTSIAATERRIVFKILYCQFPLIDSSFWCHPIQTNYVCSPLHVDLQWHSTDVTMWRVIFASFTRFALLVSARVWLKEPV